AATVASTLAARLLVRLYDLFIFLPLWLESRWRDYRHNRRIHAQPGSPPGGSLPSPASVDFRPAAVKQQAQGTGE
ncbi:MAG: hypothetical protein LAT50_16680, partial [Ectothiorhodospiraceae bacterium]|nr:hypothetical protein [Ectothiorhodospiraceae bacterium]